MKTTLLLIRHAETLWNRENRVQGFADSSLSDLGKEQSLKLAKRLAKKKIHAVYTSDYKRTLETIALALNGTTPPPILLKDLRERNLGVWEGRIWEDIVKEDPEGTQTYGKDANFRPQNGESFDELQARVLKVIQFIVKEYQGKTVALFSSGGTIRAAMMGVMEIPTHTWQQWATWNTAVAVLEHTDGRWKVIKFNDTSHLKGEI